MSRYRVEADFGKGWVFVGEANDRVGYLALADRAYKDDAREVRIWECKMIYTARNP